jgi:hypothetical protein
LQFFVEIALPDINFFSYELFSVPERHIVNFLNFLNLLHLTRYLFLGHRPRPIRNIQILYDWVYALHFHGAFILGQSDEMLLAAVAYCYWVFVCFYALVTYISPNRFNLLFFLARNQIFSDQHMWVFLVTNFHICNVINICRYLYFLLRIIVIDH